MQGVNQGFESASGKLYNFLENLETEVNVINIVRGLRNQRTKDTISELGWAPLW